MRAGLQNSLLVASKLGKAAKKVPLWGATLEKSRDCKMVTLGFWV